MKSGEELAGGARRRLPGAGRRSPRRRPIPSTWSAARCATCCWDGAAPTSTWWSRATRRRWRRRSGPSVVESHSRFGTLKVRLGRARSSTSRRRGARRYARPGALPEVELGAPIRVDLARRDFTVNAMAVPLGRAARADRSLRRPGRPRSGRAAGDPRGLLRRRPDPGDPRRPLRGPLRPRARAGDPRLAAGDRPRRRSPPTGAGRSCASWRRKRTRRAGSNCWRAGAWSSRAPAASPSPSPATSTA